MQEEYSQASKQWNFKLGVGRSVAHETLDYNSLHPCLLALLAEVPKSQQDLESGGFPSPLFLKKERNTIAFNFYFKAGMDCESIWILRLPGCLQRF